MESAMLRRHETRSTDVDDHAAALAGWEQCYTQLDAGPFRGELNHVAMPGVALFVERTNIKIRQDTVPPRDTFVLGFPLAGSAPALFHGRQAVPGDALVLARGETHEFICQDRMDIAAVVLDLGRAPDWGIDAQEFAEERTAPVLRSGAGASLGAFVLSLVGDLAAGGPMIADGVALLGLPALIATRCLGLLADSGAPAAGLSPSQRYRIVAEARALVDAADTDVPPVPVIARRLGVSVRSLEYCFAETLGLSPVLYIRNVRLNGARRDLKAAGPGDATVADIAMKWGFWHLGRFSAFYRELFGESPSETLRRPARRA